MTRLLEGSALVDRAKSLGVSIYASAPPGEPGVTSIFNTVASEAEIQKRVIDAELRLLAQRGWVVALASAVASAVSAAAAFVAIYLHK